MSSERNKTTDQEAAPGRRWIVVQSQPRKEFFAAANLANQDYRVFLPKLRKTVRHARRQREVERPLFPRYLFVELDIDRQRWRPILGTFGVASLIMADARPLPAPRGLVEAMMARADPGSVVDLSPSLEPGQRVEVLSGPFAGKIGALAALDGPGRARVLVEILGAAREIPIEADRLAPAC